jgi:tetratricopeptide (TPR) repeat protein
VSVFWFHPLLWWMERRLLAERETACDEMVLADGARAEDYVAGIAKVCRAMVESTQAYAGITGANLEQRIEHILSLGSRRSWPRILGALPILLGVFAASLPIAGGLLKAQTAQVQADGLFQTAEALRRAGDLNAALPLFLKAGDEGNLAATLQAALILDRGGRWEQALLQYEKVLKSEPDNAVALNNAAYLMADNMPGNKGDLARALAYAEHALAQRRDSLEILDTLGWIYLKTNMPDQALLAFRDPVLKQPNNFTYRSHMAQALDEKMDPPEWMRELRSLIFTSGRATDARLEELLEMIRAYN